MTDPLPTPPIASVPEPLRGPHHLAMVAASTMLVASVLVLAGWALQLPDLARLMAGATVMKASSAISFFAAGTALLAWPAPAAALPACAAACPTCWCC